MRLLLYSQSPTHHIYLLIYIVYISFSVHTQISLSISYPTVLFIEKHQKIQSAILIRFRYVSLSYIIYIYMKMRKNKLFLHHLDLRFSCFIYGCFSEDKIMKLWSTFVQEDGKSIFEMNMEIDVYFIEHTLFRVHKWMCLSKNPFLNFTSRLRWLK